MHQIFESARIALASIWGSKLRSLMTVLGNIVAVTSIIAVVSLIQGLNASVKQAILNEAGADSFVVQQFGIVRSDDEWLRVQSNPRISAFDAAAVRRYSPLVSAVMLAVVVGCSRSKPPTNTQPGPAVTDSNSNLSAPASQTATTPMTPASSPMGAASSTP